MYNIRMLHACLYIITEARLLFKIPVLQKIDMGEISYTLCLSIIYELKKIGSEVATPNL